MRKVFTCGAFVAQTVFMLATSYTDAVTPAIICLTIAVGFGGFAWSGFRLGTTKIIAKKWSAHFVPFPTSVNQLDIAPQYASLIMGLSNTIATVPGIVSPVITGFIVQNKVTDFFVNNLSVVNA